MIEQEQIDRLVWVHSLLEPVRTAFNDLDCSLAENIATGRSMLANQVNVDPVEIETKCVAKYVEKLAVFDAACAQLWRP